LANWAIIQGKLGHSPSLTYFRHYAQQLLKNNGIVHKLGKHWYTGYLVRNPEVRSSRTRLINYKRANAALIDNINIFFDRLELPEVRIIPSQNIWNADEMELIIGVGNNGIMVSEAYRKFMLSKNAGTKE
jgi:hypothetical protein